MPLYEKIDLPLAPVLVRMEQAGVKIDRQMLGTLSVDLETQCASKASEIHAKAGVTFNINSPKQLGDVLFNQLNLPKPIKYGKGKTISTAVDVLEELSETHEVPRLVLDYRQLSKLKSTYVDALPVLIDPQTGRVHTTFQPDRHHHGTAIFDQSKFAKHSYPHGAGPRDPRSIHCRTGIFAAFG